MSPQQEIFTKLRELGFKVTSNTFDYLPGEAKYPFIFIGEQFSTDQVNKTAVFGYVDSTIHFYSNNPRARGTLSKLMDDYISLLRQTADTKHYNLAILSLNSRVLAENIENSKEQLLHGIVEVRQHFSHKGE